MTFKKSLLIALLSFGIANATLAETDEEKFDRSVQYYEQQNYAAAFPLVKELAEKGDSSAQSNLALMYIKGQGVAQDDKQAAYWWQKAAEQGDADAQNRLGLAYELGVGIRRDLSKAKYYYGLACDGGNKKGCENYANLDKQGVKEAK